MKTTSFTRYITAFLISLLFFASGAQAQGRGGDVACNLENGTRMFEAGNYAGASAELGKTREWLTRAPLTERMRVEWMLAESAARTGHKDGEAMLVAFLKNYPDSPHANRAALALGTTLLDGGDTAGAEASFRRVQPSLLPASFRDEYRFGLGKSLLMSGGSDAEAADLLGEVDPRSRYGDHAAYYLAYIAYAAGRLDEAKDGFAALADNPFYKSIIPYYLLQIEFLQGNYAYVAAQGQGLFDAAPAQQKAPTARVVAESLFRIGDYGGALDMFGEYRRAGGAAGRGEEYMEGYSMYMTGDLAGAEEALLGVIGPDDDLSRNAAYHLAGGYLEKGDKKRAMQAFAMASAGGEYPLREDALFNYAKLQYELGGEVFNEAVNLLNRYIADYPDSPRVGQVREYLSAAYYNSRNYDEAYRTIKLIDDPGGDLRAALQRIAFNRALEKVEQGDYDEALRMLGEAAEQRANARITALSGFWTGEVLFRRGMHAQAAPLFERFVSVAPEDGEEYRLALYNLGYGSFNGGDYEKAEEWFGRLVKYGPGDSYHADALNRIGDGRFARRDFAGALESYGAAAATGLPEGRYGALKRAVTLGLTGDAAGKIAALESLIAPQGAYSADALYELGRTHIGAGRYAQGAEALARHISDYPSSPDRLAALATLGLARQNLGDDRGALESYETLIAEAPGSPEARDALLAARGIYMQSGDMEAYFALAERSGTDTDTGAAERDSLSFEAARRSWLSGDMASAATAMEGYLEKYPRGASRPEALFTLAEAREQLGDVDRAAEALHLLSAMHYNPYSIRGERKLAGLLYDKARYAESAAAYKRLAAMAVNPETSAAAWEGYLQSICMSGVDDDALISAADEVLATATATDGLRRKAEGVKAEALLRTGNVDRALEISRRLAGFPMAEEGARAAYRVARAQFSAGDADGAEKTVLTLAQSGTQQTYWLGEAFLLLGEIYKTKGDTFQARATLQSIVDGYRPEDDGIVTRAKEMMKTL